MSSPCEAVPAPKPTPQPKVTVVPTMERMVNHGSLRSPLFLPIRLVSDNESADDLAFQAMKWSKIKTGVPGSKAQAIEID